MAIETASKPVWRRWRFSIRALVYAILFFLIFSFTVAELGLVSFELHRYGNTYQQYPTKMYKHTIGLLLFSCIISLLFCLAHPWASVGFVTFISLAIAVFFGTGAGILRVNTPFRGTQCRHRGADSYPVAWQPYASQCSRVVSIQAIAWALWALYIILMVIALRQKFDIKARETPEELYFSDKPEEEEEQGQQKV